MNRLLIAGVAAATLLSAAPAAAHTDRPVHLATATYPDAPALPGGGVFGGFSDLYPADASGRTFWTITDRGPNNSDGANPVFVDPTFTPQIVRFSRVGSRIVVQRRIPLRTPKGFVDPVTHTREITGLPNVAPDPAPVDVHGKPLPYDPYGADTEGLVRAPDGTFWVSEENRSSVLHVAADGTVLARLVPSNQSYYHAPGIDVLPILPAVISTQKANRGFEGLAISADGKTLYVAQQSPLNNPDSKVSKKSRVLRVYRIDIKKKPKVTAEFVNLRDADSADDGDWKTSAIVWLSHDRLLIEERDATQPTVHTKLYAVDFRKATNILGSQWDSSTKPTLEQVELGKTGVKVGRKTLVFDAAAAKLDNGKIEDIAVQPYGHRALLTLVNDNDFGVLGIGSDGSIEPNGIVTRLDSYVISRP